MLGKRLKTFSTFILERADWDYTNHYKKYLGKMPGDETMLAAIKDLDETVNRLEDKYWYNREGRDFRYPHYALDMKIHEWPDLDEWAKLTGHSAEELEDDRSGLEDSMYRDWGTFMEETYEDYSEHYADSFSWLRQVGVGGKSGGWLLLAPNTDHSDLERNLEEAMDNYLTAADQVESNPDLLRILKNEEEAEELAELGILDQEQIDLAREAVEAQDEALGSTLSAVRELEEIEEDLEMVVSDIQKFRETCKQRFYEWVDYRYNQQ